MLAALCALFGPALSAQEPPGGDRPNLLFLLADDLRWDTLGFMGHPVIQTPHLDRLAREGTVFTNGFVTTSICCVSRASIFSGQYQRRHGLVRFQDEFSKEAWAETYPALLRQAGYRTGFIGKFGVGNRMPEEAFDFWRGFPGQGRYLAPGEEGHLTARMGDQALEFLRGNPPGQPFCLSISFKAPHAQDGAPREFPPDPRDEALYSEAKVPRPASGAPEFFQALPAFVRNSEGRIRWERRFATEEMREATVRDYYRLVTGMDREVGRLLEALEQSGRLERTLVVFFSDNGFFLGERGLAGKWLMHEESIRVPLIIRDPALEPSRRGGRLPQLALNIDLAPTFLDYAQVSLPPRMQGRSLRPLLFGEPESWRTEFFYEHHTLPERLPPSEGVRTVRWKYIRYIAPNPVVEELYDLDTDPLEQANLAGDPAYREQLGRLRESWERLRQAWE